MQLHLDIRHNLLDQLTDQLESVAQREREQLELSASLGKGYFLRKGFPNDLELYHLKATATVPIDMRSQNPADSEWLLCNINLSPQVLPKMVNDRALDMHKHLPSGILLYTPKTQVQSQSPPHTPFEVVLLRFHRRFLTAYDGLSLPLWSDADGAVVYEDLSPQAEQWLRQALQAPTALLAHAAVLTFLGQLFQQLRQRVLPGHYQRLHGDDLKGLFQAAALLRDPLLLDLPSTTDLSRQAGMGLTKFKTLFKQVFGHPPIQYHRRIKLEYAKKVLLTQGKSISALSYELGYAHPSKFTRAYKKQFGHLPSEVIAQSKATFMDNGAPFEDNA